jgi:hypothetical protein
MDIKEQTKGMTGSERIDFLEGHSSTIVEGQYFRPFDSEDKQQTQEEFTLKSIEIERVEAEFDLIKTKFKQRLKAMNNERSLMMQNLMQNGEWLEGKQYGFDDQIARTMTFFDEKGNFISSRRLTPNERQLTIHSQLSKIS